MEKLLRLLNIYSHAFLETNLRFTYDGNNLRVQWDEIWPYVAESIVINKKFWFIERLVKNDKINLKEFHKLCWIINQDSEYWNWTPQDYEQVIMYLSISDYPIEDLISILNRNSR